jgi:glycosyltransferase involved in cell wall biosynthesis
MITSGITNEQFPVPTGSKFKRYAFDDIEVFAIEAGYNDARYGTSLPGWKRMLAFIGFAKAATRAGKTILKPDVVFATHTPLTVGFSGIDLRKHFGVPFVFEVRDLWPEAMVNIGAIKNPLIVHLLRRWSRKIYFSADSLIAASPGIKHGILQYGVPDQKVTVIPQGCDLDLFHPDRKGEGVRKRLCLGDRFAAIYFGAMGLANGLEYAVDAANILSKRGRNDIVIVLHGQGGCREELEMSVKSNKLDNVVFSDPVPEKKDLAEIVSACDACMTIYRASKERSWSPNKMFDSLSAGKPILINVPGWLGSTIEDNECGFEIDPKKPESLADKLEQLADNPGIIYQFGRNARKLAETNFSRAAMGDRLERVLLNTVEKVRND